jgi:hypothetical protein
VARLAALNLGVPLLALPVPAPLRLLGWALVLAAGAAFVMLAALALTRARAVEDRPARDHEGRGRAWPAMAGVAAGCLLTAAAVVVATTGGAGPRTQVTATGARTVEVTLSGMSIRPSVIEAAPGTVLTLRVTRSRGTSCLNGEIVMRERDDGNARPGAWWRHRLQVTFPAGPWTRASGPFSSGDASRWSRHRSVVSIVLRE